MFRKELIESARVLKESEERGEPHRIVDLFNEDQYLNERFSKYESPDVLNDMSEVMLADLVSVASLSDMYDIDDGVAENVFADLDASKEVTEP